MYVVQGNSQSIEIQIWDTLCNNKDNVLARSLKIAGENARTVTESRRV